MSRVTRYRSHFYSTLFSVFTKKNIYKCLYFFMFFVFYVLFFLFFMFFIFFIFLFFIFYVFYFLSFLFYIFYFLFFINPPLPPPPPIHYNLSLDLPHSTTLSGIAFLRHTRYCFCSSNMSCLLFPPLTLTLPLLPLLPLKAQLLLRSPL